MSPTSSAHEKAIRATARMREYVEEIAPTRMEPFLTIAGDIATVLILGVSLSNGDAYTTSEATWCLDQQTNSASVGQAMLTLYSPARPHDIFISIAGDIASVLATGDALRVGPTGDFWLTASAMCAAVPGATIGATCRTDQETGAWAFGAAPWDAIAAFTSKVFAPGAEQRAGTTCTRSQPAFGPATMTISGDWKYIERCSGDGAEEEAEEERPRAIDVAEPDLDDYDVEEACRAVGGYRHITERSRSPARRPVGKPESEPPDIDIASQLNESHRRQLAAIGGNVLRARARRGLW